MAKRSQPSRGHIERRPWHPERDYGHRHRWPQQIDCFVPDPVAGWDPSLTAGLAATLADAAVRDLNEDEVLRYPWIVYGR